jgi:hypothetical protein
MVDASLVGVLCVADRPGEPLDELCRGVVSAQVHRADVLVEPGRRVGRDGGWVCGDDDSRHVELLFGLGVDVGLGHPLLWRRVHLRGASGERGVRG